MGSVMPWRSLVENPMRWRIEPLDGVSIDAAWMARLSCSSDSNDASVYPTTLEAALHG